MTQTDAKDVVNGISLQPGDLVVLPYERRLASKGFMKLYAEEEAEALARRKAQVLNKELLPSYDDQYNPTPAPKIDREYNPPENASPLDPPVENIIWFGEHIHGNVLAHDGKLAYLVRRHRVSMETL